MASSLQQYKLVESTKDECDWVENQIDKFNRAQISFKGQSEIFLNYYVKANNEIIAGINSCFYFEEVLCVNVLFIKEEYRRRGIGGLLLKKAEDEARKKGAKLSHLHTFDFNNAKDFYLQHGYEIYGVLDDCPSGYKHYYFKKSLI